MMKIALGILAGLFVGMGVGCFVGQIMPKDFFEWRKR